MFANCSVVNSTAFEGIVTDNVVELCKETQRCDVNAYEGAAHEQIRFHTFFVENEP